MADTEELVWYYYDGKAQVGPISERDLRSSITDGTVRPSDYVFKDGFEDWKLLADLPELQLQSSSSPEERRGASARAPIYELVVAHNDKHIATGTLRNISMTGIFLETEDQTFSINEEIKLTLKEGRGLGKPMHLKGIVVRKASDSRFPQGYGLELKELDKPTRERISDYISRQQQAG